MTAVVRITRALAILWLSAATAPRAAAAPPEPQRIEVYPKEISLDSHRAVRQIVVTGFFDDQQRDLTDQSKIISSDPKVVTLQGTRAAAVADGHASLTVTIGKHTANIPVTVANATQPDPVQFKFETVPVLTKQGCASGSCHGSPHGKGNFSLSLFGYDPAIDQLSLTRDGFNRRIDVMEPAESLLLKKPLMELSHVGGKRLLKTDTAYRILSDWIYEGAKAPIPAVECRQLIVHPASARVLRAPFMKQQLSALARFTDDAARDVSAIATYTSSNPAVAEVDADGLITGKSRGQAAISVRYLDKLESVFVTVIEDVPGFVWTNPPQNNVVDKLVDEKLRQLQYLPSDVCTDEVFVRRVYLDLTGLLPPADRARAFVADPAADKRAKLIDALLDTEDFARFWAQKRADIMRVSSKAIKNGRAEVFGDWIVDAIRKNVPYDQFARAILTATGPERDVPAGSFYQAVPTMEERTEMTAQIFMGSRLECAKCHNHPFENWTMKDYYSLGAVFVRTQEENGEVTVLEKGEAMHPTTKKPMTPLGATETAPPAKGTPTADRRLTFADWLTAKGNPFFARVEVNRTWAQLMGRGIVEPVDDFRSSNPPSNGPLLDALAAEFEKSGYDRKAMIHLICNSRAYQRSTQTNKFNETDETLFSHAPVRLLTAEQLKDAIGTVAGSLTSTSDLQTRLSQNRRDLEARQAELDAKYKAWLTDAADRVEDMPFWLGAWYSTGPFPFTGDPLKQVVEPEVKPVNLAETFAKGTRPWVLQPEIRDGKGITLEGTKNVVHYLYRRIHSEDARTIKVKVRGGNSAVVWLNENKVTAKPLEGDKEVSLSLSAGENKLLVKVISRSDSQFRFEYVPEGKPAKKPAEDLSGSVADLVSIPAKSRTDAQTRALRDLYLQSDGKYRGLRDNVQRLERRAEYATQRPVPEKTEFLTRFGQPERQSACACERTSSPTLLQALELLNGSTVASVINASPNRYAKLDDEKLIDELYVAAFGRPATEKERATAAAHLKKKAADRSSGVTDLVWAVVNSREFLFQH